MGEVIVSEEVSVGEHHKYIIKTVRASQHLDPGRVLSSASADTRRSIVFGGTPSYLCRCCMADGTADRAPSHTQASTPCVDYISGQSMSPQNYSRYLPSEFIGIQLPRLMKGVSVEWIAHQLENICVEVSDSQVESGRDWKLGRTRKSSTSF